MDNTRDYFAGLAMQALMTQVVVIAEKVPEQAYTMANAMMVERKKHITDHPTAQV